MYITDISNIMDVIKMMPPMVEGEIADADEYATKALQTRAHFPEIAQTLYDLSLEEMGHMSRLHAAVADLIDKYRAEKGEPPAPMMAMYEYLHNQQIAKAAEAKALQETFKDNK